MSYVGPVLADPEIGDREFAALADLLRAEARINLTPAKKTLVCARLGKRLRARRIGTYAEYLRLVRDDAGERAEMVIALTTNHTSFFRENHHFDHFSRELVPALKSRSLGGRPVRIWSAACSSGEEVYSIAMCLLGRTTAEAQWLKTGDVRLLATDISPPMVAAVAAATYSAASAESVPEPYRKLWLRPVPGRDEVEMAPEARALVTARQLNLFADWPLRQTYDAIFCRNVMIYFDEAAKRDLEARLIDRLAPGGYLYIGHSERLGPPAVNQVGNCGLTIYRKAGGAA